MSDQNNKMPCDLTEALVPETLGVLLDFFETENINFWLDSGSLLGFIRDKKIIKWDSDIDLGMWAEDSELFEQRLLEKNLPYKVASRSYLGQVYGWTVSSERTENGDDKEIHIHVFYRTKLGWAWSPQTIKQWSSKNKRNEISNEEVSLPFINYLNSKLRYFLKLGIRFLKRRLDRFYWAKLFPLSEIYTSGTWLINSDYFDQLVDSEWGSHQIKYPLNVNDYLAKRYGEDWRTPNKNWVYYRDDGCLFKGGPEVALKRILHPSLRIQSDSQLSELLNIGPWMLKKLIPVLR